MPLLLAGGAGALGYWRVRSSSLAELPDLGPLRDTYRAYTLEAAVHEVQLAEAAQALRAASVPALLGKGWAAARAYAQPALRPYGDLDFFVAAADRRPRPRSPAQLPRPLPVDLHQGFAELDDRGAAGALRARVQRRGQGRAGGRCWPRGPPAPRRPSSAPARGVALRSGCATWRRSSRPPLPSFDWDLVLQGPRQRARSVAAVVWLAERLLGARIPNRGTSRRPRRRRPARVARGHGPPPVGKGLRPSAARWGRSRSGREELLGTLLRRWPNAVEATAGMDAPFDDSPRWPHQAAFAAVRAFRFARSRGRLDRRTDSVRNEYER